MKEYHFKSGIEGINMIFLSLISSLIWLCNALWENIIQGKA